MKRAATLLSVCALLLAYAAPAMANQPAQRFTESAVGEVFVCEDANYTITSGQISIVIHEGQSASGNENFTVTVTPRHVTAEDEEGNTYRIVGAFWAGATFNVNNGVFQSTVTDHFQILAQGGGTVDSVQATFHITEHDNNLVVKEFDLGTCASPED